MVGRPGKEERKHSPVSSDRRFDCEIATAMLAVAWAVILWRLLHPALWPFVLQAIQVLKTWPRPRNGPSCEVLVVVLYSCAILVLWWAPLRHVAQRMQREAGRAPDELERLTGEALRNPRAITLRFELSLSGGQSEVEMRHLMIGFILLGVAFAPGVSAQPKSYSSSDARTLVAAGELPVVSAMPLYFRVLAATISSAEESRDAEGNGVLYQFSGATELSIAGSVRTLSPGQGTYVAGGGRFTVKAVGETPSTYLYFVVSPGALSADSRQPSPSVREIYRSSVPIANLKQGSYLLNLSRVTLPASAPPDSPHHRTGAALHYVVSGFGAETANGMTIAKGPGSISYEPDALVYQWSNPGYPPLTYLVFNLNPENEDAVVIVACAVDRQ
jgi:uncharacterized RmlC-like cupin family protein